MVMEGVRGGSGGRVTRPALGARWRRPLFMDCCGGADGLHVDVVIQAKGERWLRPLGALPA